MCLCVSVSVSLCVLMVCVCVLMVCACVCSIMFRSTLSTKRTLSHHRLDKRAFDHVLGEVHSLIP